MDASLWRRFQLFWSSDVAPLKAETISVSMNVFMENLSWLRDVWAPAGGWYEIEPALLENARKFRTGADAFKKLKLADPTRHAGKTIDVPGLSPSRNLTPEQNSCILYLLDMQNGANFSVPGSGKTLVSLCVWQILRSANSVAKMLVVAPKSAFEAWESEVRDSFNGAFKTELYSGNIFDENTQLGIVNYEQLENADRLSYLTSWVSANSACLVVDEAHRIKAGRGSVRWSAVKRLSEAGQRTDILTGTPMPQGPKDLVGLFGASWPKLTKTELDERTLPLLRRNTVFVRTTKGELHLPPANLVQIAQEPSYLQRQILDALRDQYGGASFLSIADARNLAKRGKAVMSLMAAATNPGLLSAQSTFSHFELGFTWPPRAISMDAELTRLIDEYTLHEIPWKFEYAAMRVEELFRSGEKTLIWSNFIGNLGALKTVLHKFNPAVVYGNVSQEERVRELHKFRTDPSCSVLLSNPQTLGEGVSLHQVCHTEIFIDRTFNAGLYLQAVDRIHRLGLEPDQVTTIEFLSTRGTIDERIASRLSSKIASLSSFLQDSDLAITSIPTGDELAPDEVLGLTDEDFSDIAEYWTKL